MHLLHPTGPLKPLFKSNHGDDQTGFKKQKHPFTRYQGCFSQIWILILLVFLILILLILKLRRKLCVNLDKIKKWSILLASFHFGYLNGALFKCRFYICSFYVQKKFWANLVKNYRMIH